MLGGVEAVEDDGIVCKRGCVISECEGGVRLWYGVVLLSACSDRRLCWGRMGE